MSLRTEFAEAIYKGLKGYEFRRVRSSLRSGDRVLMYECAPVSSLTGEFCVGKVVTSSPSELLRLEANVSMRAKAGAYLSGAEIATAIEVSHPVRWKRNYRLDELIPNFRPPQSYAFVTDRANELLRSFT